MGDGWDLYVAPKKDDKDKKDAKKAALPAAGTDGTMELPGSPRPPPGRTSEHPNGPPSASSEDFTKQRPKGAEEDAEIWDSRKGWTTPSGKKQNLAPGVDGKIDTTPDAPVSPEIAKKLHGSVESDDDTEVITAPKRQLPPEDGGQRRGSSALPSMSDLKKMGGTGKTGTEGKDFHEYTKPATPAPTMVGGVAPQHGGGAFGSLLPQDGTISYPQRSPGGAAAPSNSFGSLTGAGTPSPGAQQPPKFYGQSEVPTAPAAPRPSGRMEVAGYSTPAPAPRPTTPTTIAGFGNAPSGAPSGHAPAAPLNAPHMPQSPPMQVHVPALPRGILNVLLVGSGAREHAMALAIRRSQRAQVYVVMKHRNPGIAKSATGFKIIDDRDVPAIVQWARISKIHLAVIGPEAPLEAGLADALRAVGIAVASPSQAAARIETSKTFMRSLMAKHDVPGRLAFHPFDNLADAERFLDRYGPAWAIKPVGLTGGKGVQVHGDHFHDLDGAKAYVRAIFANKSGGGALQFEELARGEEFTLMAFTDGATLVPMPAVQDHKRLYEGDQGPNTGGMGSYTQADGLLPFLSREDYNEAARILHGIVGALAAEGTPYVGAIYGQFMLTATGPKVIEVNARFGDPEAINVLHLLESDYLAILEGMVTGTLAGQTAQFRQMATVVKYVVPMGYGDGTPAAGKYVQVDDFNIKRSKGTLFLAGLEQQMSGPLVTMMGRTLAILGEGPSIEEANAVCEASLKHVHGDALFCRHDIGTMELLHKRVQHMAEIRGQTTLA